MKQDFNKLVPKLIEKSENLSKEIKYRIKLNHIFSEFESKSGNQFNFFIKESEKRYLGSKYGTKIEYILNTSNKRGKKEALKILNDDFYLNRDILNERKKMQTKSTNEIHKNITDIINEIKKVKNDSLTLSKKKSRNIFRSRINLFKNLKTDNIFKNSNKNLNRNKNDINSLFFKEEKNVKYSFDNYKNFIKSIDPIVKKRIVTEEDEDSKNKEDINNKDNKSILKKKYNFSMPKMELLSYKKPIKHIRTRKDEDEENRVNIKTLLPYSVSGKNIFPKLKNFNKINSSLFSNKNNKDAFIINSTNTIIVKKALEEFNSNKIFLNKNNKIINKLGIEKIPSLGIYEKIIKNNSNKIRLRRKYLNERIYNNQKNKGLNYLQKLDSQIVESINYINNFEKNYPKLNTISY